MGERIDLRPHKTQMAIPFNSFDSPIDKRMGVVYKWHSKGN